MFDHHQRHHPILHLRMVFKELGWKKALIHLYNPQALDAIDGKQARRTGTACPLGELFDHGCDSLSTVVVSIASCCALRWGPN